GIMFSPRDYWIIMTSKNLGTPKPIPVTQIPNVYEPSTLNAYGGETYMLRLYVQIAVRPRLHRNR
ncbi:MAG: hypothetical protein WA672_05550, partial [Candidatus Angelobacter sp.]